MIVTHALSASAIIRDYTTLVVTPRIDRAIEQSLTTTFTRVIERFVRASYLYRWFTTEPDPAVIVIDRRETYSVGPVIIVLDRLFVALQPVWRRSLLKRATDSAAAILKAAAETRAGQLVAALLEPPEPPEDRDDDH